MSSKKMYIHFVKPLLDRVAALMLLLLCSPLLVILALVLAVTNRGDVLFFHTRVGKEEKLFQLIKLRTMRKSDDDDVPKTTPFGSFLRKLSLDELPQLINVLSGSMSLVGPRPLLKEYLPYYTKEEKERHKVAPGITGWAQVNGRNKSSWAQRMDNDRYYVGHISFLLDLRILFLTFVQLFKWKQADFEAQAQETFVEYAKRR